MPELTSVFGNPIQDVGWLQVAAAIAVVVALTVARGPIAKWLLQAVSAALRYFDFSFSEEMRLAAQRGAELFVFALGLLLGIALLDLQGQLGVIANKVSFSILIAAIFSAAFESASLGAAVLASSKHSRRTMNAGWIEKILKVTAVVLGVASVLKVWGIDIGPILTGVGIAGAATALAAQDLFKNLIAGMSNMAEERFAIGDWIRAEGVAEGIVEDVSLRSTAVRQFDMTLVHIPNSALADAPLINVSKMRHRQIRATVKLHCGTTVEQLSQIAKSVRNFLSGSNEFAQPPAARQNVHVAGFSDEAIDMLVYCFTESTEFEDFLKARESLVLAIRAAIADAAAEFAYESRSIIIRETPGDLSHQMK
jgi:MscS family membrane protein